MTYEELYKKVESIWHDSFKSPEMTALLDVVKLHQPFEFNWGSENFISCKSCGEADYPCRTIKIISEGLS